MIALLYAALTIVLGVSGCSGHPADEELLDQFRRQRVALERLVRMFEEDAGLGRVGKDFTRPGDPSQVGVSPERIREYRLLCEEVGAPDCIEGYKDPIWIHVSARGLSISGSSKGYLYSDSPPFDVVPDLDSVSPRESGTWLRHIEGPWYIYFDYED